MVKDPFRLEFVPIRRNYEKIVVELNTYMTHDSPIGRYLRFRDDNSAEYANGLADRNSRNGKYAEVMNC